MVTSLLFEGAFRDLGGRAIQDQDIEATGQRVTQEIRVDAL
jgi:hypothetical protein